MKTLAIAMTLFLCVQFSQAQNGTVEATEGIVVGNNSGVVAGTIRWTGTDFEGYDGSNWNSLTNGSASLWSLNGNGAEIFYNADKVAIGKADPNKTLDVQGQTRIQSGADGANYQLEVVENGFGRGGIQFRNSSNSVDYWALGAGLETANENKIGWYRNGDEKVVYHNSITNETSGGMKIGSGIPTEKLDVDGAIVIGDSANNNAGTIRWTGTDFEGYNGTDWVSLTTSSNGASQTKVISAHALNYGYRGSGEFRFIGSYIYGLDHSNPLVLDLDLPEGTVVHQVRPMVYDASSTVELVAICFKNTTTDGASSSTISNVGVGRSNTLSTYDYYDVLFSDVTIGPGESCFLWLFAEDEVGSNTVNWPFFDIRIVKIEITYTLP